MRKTAADVHLELAVHEKGKTAFHKFTDLEIHIKELDGRMADGQKTITVLLVGLLASVVTLLIESILL